MGGTTPSFQIVHVVETFDVEKKGPPVDRTSTQIGIRARKVTFSNYRYVHFAYASNLRGRCDND